MSAIPIPWLKNRSWAWFPGDKKPSKWSWKWHAVERWGKEALWIIGQGKYAVVSRCGPRPTVSLWFFQPQAKQRLRVLQRHGCGKGCQGYHELVVLPARRRP